MLASIVNAVIAERARDGMMDIEKQRRKAKGK